MRLELAATNEIRYRIAESGTRVALRFEPPLEIDWGAGRITRMAGTLRVRDRHPSLELYRIMRKRSEDHDSGPFEPLAALGASRLLAMAADESMFVTYRRDAAWALACGGDAATDAGLATLLENAVGEWRDDLSDALAEAYERRRTPAIADAVLADCRRCGVADVPGLVDLLDDMGQRVPGLIALLASRDEQVKAFACAEILQREYSERDRRIILDVLTEVQHESEFLSRLIHATVDILQSREPRKPTSSGG